MHVCVGCGRVCQRGRPGAGDTRFRVRALAPAHHRRQEWAGVTKHSPIIAITTGRGTEIEERKEAHEVQWQCRCSKIDNVFSFLLPNAGGCRWWWWYVQATSVAACSACARACAARAGGGGGVWCVVCRCVWCGVRVCVCSRCVCACVV